MVSAPYMMMSATDWMNRHGEAVGREEGGCGTRELALDLSAPHGEHPDHARQRSPEPLHGQSEHFFPGIEAPKRLNPRAQADDGARGFALSPRNLRCGLQAEHLQRLVLGQEQMLQLICNGNISKD
eukprot:844350-Rhodomonas_salina.2